MSGSYEDPQLLQEYLLFHYGAPHEVLPWPEGPADALGFPVRTVLENVPAGARRRALDLGCAVGRSTFELSRFCREVVGVDLSAAFITAAERLRTRGELAYTVPEEGRLSRGLLARCPEGSRPERIRFLQADVTEVPLGGTFDLVHAANLLCRLADPLRLLRRLPGWVETGGLLVLTTPCTWREEFTPPDQWPPGGTLEWLRDALQAAFSLEAVRDQPFLIREHRRKFQWSVAQASVWRRLAC